MLTAVQSVADKLHAADHVTGEFRTSDQLRADALVAICAATLCGTVIGELPLQQGVRPSIQVTVALSSLLGLDDQPGELDGYGPIPAEVARRIAADESGTWRRLLVDEVGELVDYGRRKYRPPADLRDFIIARDRTDRYPGSNRPARRCEVDHRRRWVDGGHTNQENLQSLGKRGHLNKDDHGWTCTRLSDGTTRWVSPLERTYDKPSSAYPLDMTRPQQVSDDPPPF